MRKTKISVIGCFYSGREVSDGQGVKTKILTEELERLYGIDSICRIDTYGWKRNPFRLLAQSVHAVWNSDNVIFLTDDKGTKVFPHLLYWANVTRKSKIHYYVVGGWLSGYLDKSKPAANVLRKMDAIYVELSAMQKELEERGFHNVVLVNKFRRMVSVNPEDIPKRPIRPYQLCFFSRVMKEKGLEEAVSAVKLMNERAGCEKYTLDIFGAVHSAYQTEFAEMQKSFPPYIRYGGVIDFHKSGSVLKDYFAMLFPTFYTSEGYPNVIVDAFSAGLPVVATRWNYNGDIIRNWIDGVLVDVGNVEEIADAVEMMVADEQRYAEMRANCLARCAEYLPENAIIKVVEHLR